MAIYIALGANIGDKKQTMERALALLEEQGVHVLRVSDFLETEPYGVTDQPPFLNAVAQVETALAPLELLRVLLDTERALGRVRVRHWGERNIDLDLLLYDDQVLQTPELTLPHPDMNRRDFVLRPLAQIAPDAWHPVLRQTAAQLLKALESKS